MANPERGSTLEKLAKISKKIDVVMIGGGLAIFVFNPGVGAAIIIGSALTIIPAEMILRRKKKG